MRSLKRPLLTTTAALALAGSLTACGSGPGRAGSTPDEHAGHDTTSSAPVESPTGSGDSSGSGHGSHGSDAPSATASGSSATGDHNDADTRFAMMMVPHHQQAVEMSRLAADRAASPEVKRLAAQIEKAQGPEITAMQGMLAGWGEEKASTDWRPHAGHMDGILSTQEMGRLRSAKGPTFDLLFIEGMKDHHEGAVEMAKEQLEDGTSPPARKLAQEVISTQTKEIAQMEALRRQLTDD